jgi:hypothetical protein
MGIGARWTDLRPLNNPPRTQERTMDTTPVRIDYATLADLDPAARFTAAGKVQDQARTSQGRYRAMIVMELWEAACGPRPAPIVAETLGISTQRVHQLLQTGQAWLWSTVADPAVGVLMDPIRKAELADVLDDEGDTWSPLVQRIRRTRGQHVALTLTELTAILPIVEAIPEAYAERDRLVPVIESARWDAADEQRARFNADLLAMTHRGFVAETWADLYGYRRAVTVLERVLDHDPERLWAPYLGEGADDASKGRLRDLEKQAHRADLLPGVDMSMDEHREREARIGTWRWGLANA